MFGTLTRKPRRTNSGNHGHKTRPVLENLEDRLLLFATSGGSWVYPNRISFSFVPDGTSIGGVPSNMFATLNKVASTNAWQSAIEQAAAIWSSAANINLALVPDNGAALGTGAYQQGDPNMGDIRISMIPQAAGNLAYTILPPPINGGSAAGDIVFNSNVSWYINGNYDLETVALHELGHALGLSHTTASNSVMNAYYTGVDQTPSADDISGIQSIYGAPPAPAGSNHTLSTAWNITPYISPSTNQITLANQSILGKSDSNFWYVTAPANTTGVMTVTMQSTLLGSLPPNVVIYNSAGTAFVQNSLNGYYGGTAVIQVTGVTPGMGFYIQNRAALGVGGYGAYGLIVNFGSGPQGYIPGTGSYVPTQADQGGGSAYLSSDGVSTVTTTASGNSGNGASSSDLANPFAATFNVGGKTESFSGVIADLDYAQANLAADPTGSLKSIVNDTAALMSTFTTKSDLQSDTYKELSALNKAATKGNLKSTAAALTNFLGDVFQVGTVTAYADALTIGKLRTEQAPFGRHARPRVQSAPHPLSKTVYVTLPHQKPSVTHENQHSSTPAGPLKVSRASGGRHVYAARSHLGGHP